jgi:hypothetical protein
MKDINDKVFLVYRDQEGVYQEESVWVTKKNQYYSIDNAPFFAENLASGDIISVEKDGGRLYFLDLIGTSGHSTIHVVLFEQSYEKIFIECVEKKTCTWEGTNNNKYFSIDVPKSTDYSNLKVFLNDSRATKMLDYKEACLSDKHRSQIQPKR